ncbi:MAG: YkgJ family cysteine cluster protein [Methanotrichaceae archaeon]|nr:YkgJ family cysteine cluster protein [Methanotrichaceae archaeon]
MSEDEVWYSEGLRFQCQRCGRCCGGEPGLVWITPEEIQVIAEYLGVHKEYFQGVYLREMGGRFTIADRLNGDCFLLSPEKRGCRIYPVRPIQCRAYPWWSQILASPDDWAAEANRCPGIGNGRLWTREEIEEMTIDV